jgi:quercetin dioxygenase-like cupin family protein
VWVKTTPGGRGLGEEDEEGMKSDRPKAKPTVQIDNDRVIVTEWRFVPGAETGRHRHGYDYVVVPQTSGRLLLETKEGHNETELQAGRSYFRNMGVEHNVVNINDFEFAFVEIELKL